MRRESAAIIKILKDYFREGGVTLEADTPFHLLVATVLSAQCTDERINRITPVLFAKYGDAHALAKASLADVKEIIRSAGFYNQKARNIIGLSRILAGKYGGEVPSGRGDLQSLPGVGRKTANIILSRIFGVPAIAVDTHVKRVSRRIFGINETDPDRIERRLMEIVPERLWNDVNLMLIFLGRNICSPRNPRCQQCPINRFCVYFSAIRSR